MTNHRIHKRYKVIRGEQVAQRLATDEEVEEFLDACGMVKGTQKWEAAKAGVPVIVDKAEMRFVPQKES